jgi:fatty-acid desaturase
MSAGIWVRETCCSASCIPQADQQYNALAPDVAADPFYQLIGRPVPYALAMHLHAAIPLLLAWLGWGRPGLVGIWITLVALYNMGDAIDSVSHIYGSKLAGQRDLSRNSLLMGILIMGEGWHANHHRYPWSARHGLEPRQFDGTWQIIRLLGAVGLARNIRTLSSPNDLAPAELIEEL